MNFLKILNQFDHIYRHYKHHLGEFKVHPYIQKNTSTPLKSQMI